MTNRRQFLRSTAPLIVAPSVLGRAGAVAPNSRVRLACIGVGNQGTGNLKNFLADERVEVVAVCDVDAQRVAAAVKLAGLGDADGYHDFREVLAREDIDAVMNATPDHWHSNIAVAAARAGKDLYSEKPLAGSIAEGRAICKAVEENQRVLQCGTWRRAGLKVRMACEFVRNGVIGELKEIEVGVIGNFKIRGGFTGLEGPEPVPDHFDYKMWLGPAAERPYTPARCHFNFRWIDEYAPGYITDWGVHFVDVAQWGAGMDETTPVEVQASGIRRREGLYDAPEDFHLEYRYANGVKLRMFNSEDTTTWGTKFIGTEGWILTENETLKASNIDLLRTKLGDDAIRLFESKHHHRNFIDAVLTRGQNASPAPIAQRAATVCHMGGIAARLGRPLKFDPVAERFENDEEANNLLIKPMRDPWKLV